MLRELRIKNVAVIDEVNIEFGDGFNVLTGETGAGKSILIDSISMALGSRMSHDLIRSGCDKASVHASFTVESPIVKEKIEEMGFEIEDDLLTISRVLTAEGKSTCRINGIIAPLAAVRETAELLIDIHGQSDNRSLLNSKNHMALLDSFAGDEAELSEYRAAYKKMREIRREIKSLSTDEEEKARRLDLLSFRIDEITAANLKTGEDEELETRREYLYNIEKIVSGAGLAYEALYGGETSAYDLLRAALRSISDITEFDERLKTGAERLESVIAEVEDVASDINGRLGDSDFSMAELDAIETRLDLISGLKRKYGAEISDILAYREKAAAEASLIEGSDERLTELKAELGEAMAVLGGLADSLSKKRTEAASVLESRITDELTALDMPKVRFEVSITENSDDDNIEYTESGKDVVEFLISTNPGESLKPMAKIASGGELSRIMLAVKSVLSDEESADTMIFDEIDTGVSGRAAQRIAEKIQCLAKNKQILAITHLAQLASMADSHYLIRKDQTDSDTKTTVVGLSEEMRVEEIARILGGVSVTDLTRESAREMLHMAEKMKNE